MTTVAALGVTADPVGLLGTAAAGLLAFRCSLGPARLAALGLSTAALLVGTCVWPGSLAGTSLTGYVISFLVLLLVVPTLLALARPGEALMKAGVRTPSIPAFLANPGVSTLLVPVITGLVVFTPVLGFATGSLAGRDLVAVVTLYVGCVAAFPLASHGTATSLGIGLGLLLAIGELIADAVPGLVLRLLTHPLHAAVVLAATRHHTVPMTDSALADQQQAGGTLWAVAELVDLPVLVLLLRAWIRVDAREAAEADALDDARRIVVAEQARVGSAGAAEDREAAVSEPVTSDAPHTGPPAGPSATVPQAEAPDVPWWETDGRLGARRTAQLRQQRPRP